MNGIFISYRRDDTAGQQDVIRTSVGEDEPHIGKAFGDSRPAARIPGILAVLAEILIPMHGAVVTHHQDYPGIR